MYKNNLYDYPCVFNFYCYTESRKEEETMSELNILQQNIDKPNTVTEEDIRSYTR